MIHSEQAEGDGGKKELSFHRKRLLKVSEKKPKNQQQTGENTSYGRG